MNFKNIFINILLLFVSVIFISCELISEEEKNYTITFNSNSGSLVSNQTIVEGKKIIKPTDPTRDDYAFNNWYSDTGLTTFWDFDTDVIKSDMTLYAGWTALPTYTITFNSNAGSEVTNLSIMEGYKATKPTDPTRTDYTFTNWYSDTELTTLWDFDTEVIKSDITLYAGWETNLSNETDTIELVSDIAEYDEELFGFEFTVIDYETKNPIPNAIVSLKTGDWTTTTDIDGKFILPSDDRFSGPFFTVQIDGYTALTLISSGNIIEKRKIPEGIIGTWICYKKESVFLGDVTVSTDVNSQFIFNSDGTMKITESGGVYTNYYSTSILSSTTGEISINLYHNLEMDEILYAEPLTTRLVNITFVIEWSSWKLEGDSFIRTNGHTSDKYFYSSDETDDNFVVGDIGPSGGYIFYDKGSYSDNWRYLEAAPVDISETKVWGTEGFNTEAKGMYIGMGAKNTSDIIARDSSTANAAHACTDYSLENNGNTYDDWFLPSMFELKRMYDNLISEDLGGFEPSWYWSSDELVENDYAARLNFGNGSDGYYFKSGSLYVRPVRVF